MYFTRTLKRCERVVFVVLANCEAEKKLYVNACKDAQFPVLCLRGKTQTFLRSFPQWAVPWQGNEDEAKEAFYKHSMTRELAALKALDAIEDKRDMNEFMRTCHAFRDDQLAVFEVFDSTHHADTRFPASHNCCNILPTQVAEHLLLGGVANLRREVCAEFQIRHIVSIGFGVKEHCLGFGPLDWQLDFLAVEANPLDDGLTSLREYFLEVCEFIHERVGRGENVLVHCVQGVSRSPTFVLAYLMWADRISLTDAFYALKAKRGMVQPKGVFVHDLLQWEFELFGARLTLTHDFMRPQDRARNWGY